jgi:hypothetical protein
LKFPGVVQYRYSCTSRAVFSQAFSGPIRKSLIRRMLAQMRPRARSAGLQTAFRQTPRAGGIREDTGCGAYFGARLGFQPIPLGFDAPSRLQTRNATPPGCWESAGPLYRVQSSVPEKSGVWVSQSSAWARSIENGDVACWEYSPKSDVSGLSSHCEMICTDMMRLPFFMARLSLLSRIGAGVLRKGLQRVRCAEHHAGLISLPVSTE